MSYSSIDEVSICLDPMKLLRDSEFSKDMFTGWWFGTFIFLHILGLIYWNNHPK
jgi:hypothetical protein